MVQSPILGELEIKVMEHLWIHREGTVKSVHEHLSSTKKLSTNTIQSALERLFRKELLVRSKQSHSYIYSVKVSKEELLGSMITDMLGRFGTDSQLSTAAIINAAESIDDDALNMLGAEIERRRKVGES
ncbi:BlaI/MecI/CopY family transcriptional regulator [Pleionea sp. CnH1-48]|uniref:BlaI/MecI/CopY family transcriptional regulator n=1 Tax=Pleionea sp. CnH1-48 TaxID=2954494 RepID=UPI002111A12D|nr:BlaI/MecI/CopY family transcriptional regulator [Pleionea sp. CnH1-48]